MKILFITQRYAPAIGGAELHVRQIAEWNISLGNEVDVWTSDALEADALWYPKRKKIDLMEEDINGVHVRRFKASPFFLNNVFINKVIRYLLIRMPFKKLRLLGTPPLCWEMIREVKKNDSLKYDVVVVSAMPYHILFSVGSKLARKIGAKLYLMPLAHTGISDNDPLHKKYFDPMVVDFFRYANTVFVQTETEKNALSTFFEQHGLKLPSETFQKVGLGIYPEEVLGGKGERFRKNHNIDQKTPIVFYVGAREGVKGVYNLINASKILWKKGLNFKLALAGSNSVAFENYWAKESEEVKKNCIVLERPPQEEKWDLYDAGNVFVMISKSESFGIVYLEAWAYKKPVIGCNIGAVSEIISDNSDGYLLDFDDSEALADKIEYLLNHPDEAKRMGENGYTKTMEEYTWDKKFKIMEPYFNDKK